ncbi:hypothetical protein PC128_g9433 [Phytophthora cactorum]|nr:hypothetical protein PC128_g9433 [Phytophthora cactorum]
MAATGETDLTSSISSATAAFCLDNKNITSDSCVAFINKAIASDASFDKSVLDKYTGLKDWLLLKTADKISTDANGNKTIISACATADGLSRDQCEQLCQIYPDLCANDQINKCQMSMYRYSKEGLENNADIEYEEEEECGCAYEILLWVMLLVFAILATYTILSYVFGRRSLNAQRYK